MKSTHRIVIFAVIACLLWATSFVFVKVALQYAPPLTLAGLRFLLAGLLLLPFCGPPRRLLRAVVDHWRFVLVVSVFSTVVLYICFFYGMSLTRGAQGAIVVGSAPLLAALLAHHLAPADRLTRPKFLAILLGCVGVVLVALAAQPWAAAGLREVGGMGLLVLGEVSFVVGNLIVLRKMRAELPAMVLNCAQMGSGGVVLLLLATLIEGVPQLVWQPDFLGSLAAMAVISAAAFSIWFYLLQFVTVSALNVWKFLIPVFGALLSWTLLPNESPDTLSLLGMVIIAGAIVLFYRARGEDRPLPAPSTRRCAGDECGTSDQF